MENARKLPCSMAPVASAFRALASPVRLLMLNLLLEEPRNVSYLAMLTHERQSSVSRHLQVLAASGFIRRTRRGNEIICSANVPLVRRLWKMCGPLPAPGHTEEAQNDFCPEI